MHRSGQIKYLKGNSPENLNLRFGGITILIMLFHACAQGWELQTRRFIGW